MAHFEVDPNHYDHPSLQGILEQQSTLRPDLVRRVTYMAPSESDDTILIPGDLQTEAYAHEVIRFGPRVIPRDVANVIVEARQQRISTYKTLGEVSVKFYIHEAVAVNPRFEGKTEVLAAALKYAATVADAERDWLDVRIVRQHDIDTAPADLVLAPDFIITEHATGGLPKRTAYYNDGFEVAAPGGRRSQEAFVWADILGEVALSQQDSSEFLRNAAEQLRSTQA